MGSVATFSLVLLVVTTVIHYEVLRLMTIGLPAVHIRARAKLIIVIFGAFIAHAIEIILYATAFYLLVRYLGAGMLGTPGRLSFSRCVYFSGETYTSLGYGDIVPYGALRLLAGMEALNGLLLIGWTASYTYIAMERFWIDADK
jgi:hypothetical protein